MRKLVLVFLLLPVLSYGQNLSYAIFDSAAVTSSAVTIGNGGLFTGLVIPDAGLNSDSLMFLASRDGTNFYELHDARADSAKRYYVKVDTTNAIYLPLDPDNFINIRRLKVVVDDSSSANQDTIQVVWQDKSWWQF